MCSLKDSAVIDLGATEFMGSNDRKSFLQNIFIEVHAVFRISCTAEKQNFSELFCSFKSGRDNATRTAGFNYDIIALRAEFRPSSMDRVVNGSMTTVERWAMSPNDSLPSSRVFHISAPTNKGMATGAVQSMV